MDDYSTPPLFDLKARQLTWRLSAHLLHFNDGLMVTHFTKTTIQPFQVITWHVSEVPAQYLSDRGRLETFRRAVEDVAFSEEVERELTGQNRSRRAAQEARSAQADGAVNYPSWWVE